MFQDESTGGEKGYVERGGVKVLISTAPDEETAVKLARALVEHRLVACVNVIPKLRSIYRWQGKVEEAAEALLVIKTTSESAAQAAEILRREHPYECPEVVTLDATGGLDAYLSWVTAESRPA